MIPTVLPGRFAGLDGAVLTVTPFAAYAVLLPSYGWLVLNGLLVISAVAWILYAGDRRAEEVQARDEGMPGLSVPTDTSDVASPRRSVLSQYCLWTSLLCLLAIAVRFAV